MSTSTKTKSQLEDEVESLRANLEDAHQRISRALGYSATDEEELDDEDELDDDDDEDEEDDEA